MSDIEQFELLLKYHDWYYMMSDDIRAYSKGVKEAQEICEVYKRLCEIGQQQKAQDLKKQYGV
jgi:hypothetical protein